MKKSRLTPPATPSREALKRLEDELAKELEQLKQHADDYQDAQRSCHPEIPSSSHAHRMEREALLKQLRYVDQVRETQQQDALLGHIREAARQPALSNDNVLSFANQVFTHQVQDMVLVRQELLRRWTEHAPSLPSRVLATASQEVAMAEGRAVELTRKTADKSLLLEDLIPVLTEYQRECEARRHLDRFLVRIRWLALTDHDVIRDAMMGRTPVTQRYIPGSLADLMATRAGSASRGRHSSHGLSLTAANGDDNPLLRSTMPLNQPNYANHQLRLRFLGDFFALQFRLSEAPADQLQAFYQAQHLFQRRFTEQCNEAAHDRILIDADIGFHRGPQPQEEHAQEKRTAHLLSVGEALDELLKMELEFALRNDYDYATLRLRQRGHVTRSSGGSKSLQVSSFADGDVFTGGLWQDLYSAERGVNTAPTRVLAPVTETEEEEEDASGSGSSKDKTNRKDTLAAYLLLRHVAVRECRSQVAAYLNYFHSVQRTLHHEHAQLQATRSAESRLDLLSGGQEIARTTGADPSKPTGTDNETAPGSDSELNSTPDTDSAPGPEAKPKFVRDRYKWHGNCVAVLDSMGDPRHYAGAQAEMARLEHELMSLGTHYLQRLAKTTYASQGQRKRQQAATRRASRPRSASASSVSAAAAEEERRASAAVDLQLFGNGTADRAEVLFDLWLWELNFVQEKQRLLAVLHAGLDLTRDARQRASLVQQMINVLHERPKYDLEADYFVTSFHLSCVSYRLRRELYLGAVTGLLQRDSDASMAWSAAGHSVQMYSIDQRLALPMPVVDLFTVHASVGNVAHLAPAIAFALQEASRTLHPVSQNQFSRLEAALLSQALTVWEQEQAAPYFEKECSVDVASLARAPVGRDPKTLVDLVRRVARSELSQLDMEDQLVRGQGLAAVALETLRCRSMLLTQQYEGIVLAKLHRRLASQLNVGEHHAFVRPLTFMAAGHAKAEEEDPYVPSHHGLALFELDDAMVNNMALASEERVYELLTKAVQRSSRVGTTDQSGHSFQPLAGPLGDLQAAMQAQISHTALLSTVVDHMEAFGAMDAAQTQACRDKITSSVGDTEAAPAHAIASDMCGFVSIQLIKTRARAQMHTQYLQLLSTRDPYLLRREMVAKFSELVADTCEDLALRVQIARYLQSLRGLLNAFPSTRDNYFLDGSPELTARRQATTEALLHDKSAPSSSLQAKMSAAEVDEALERQKRTPLKLLSEDGQQLLNLWYLPHRAEVAHLYSNLPVTQRRHALQHLLALLAPLHDIIMFLCAHARLGSSHARLGTYDVAFQGVGADWGGAEGIGTELRKIKSEIAGLRAPNEPACVTEFLRLKRNMMFLEWDLTVRFYVRETFLGMRNQRAYDTVTINMATGLPALSMARQCASVLRNRFHGPAQLCAWFELEARQGPFLLGHPAYSEVANHMELCLAKLSDMERHNANGEVLGVSLLLEDIIEQELRESDHKDKAETYKVLQDFLIMSIRLEQLRFAWARLTLNLDVMSPETLAQFLPLYDAQVVAPVVTSLRALVLEPTGASGRAAAARKKVKSTAGLLVGQGTALELYNVPELFYRRSLVAELETQIRCALVSRSISKVARVRKLLQLSTSDTEQILPYQAWAKLQVQRAPERSRRQHERTLQVPQHVARLELINDFAARLLREARMDHDDGTVQLPARVLRDSLKQLGQDMHSRERERYMTFNELHKAIVAELISALDQSEAARREAVRASNRSDLEIAHAVECGIADRTYDMVHEITALRATVSRLRDEHRTQARDIRESVKRDYDDLVNNLFSTSFALKNQFEEYRLSLHEDVVEGLSEVRRTALQRMKLISVGKHDEKFEAGLKKADDLRDVQNANASLTALVLKMRTMNDWKRTGLRSHYGKKVHEAAMTANAMKQQLWDTQLIAQEAKAQRQHEVTALRAELLAAKKGLQSAQADLKHERAAREALEQWKASKVQLITAVEKQAKVYNKLDLDVEKVADQLEEQMDTIAQLHAEIDRLQRESQLRESKLRLDIKATQQQAEEDDASLASERRPSRPMSAPLRRRSSLRSPSPSGMSTTSERARPTRPQTTQAAISRPRPPVSPRSGTIRRNTIVGPIPEDREGSWETVDLTASLHSRLSSRKNSAY